MSLFDILNSGTLGATLGTLTDKAKSTASTLGREAPGGVGGLLGAGALGALLGTVLSKDMVKNAALVGAGAVAWNFYQKWSQNKGQSVAAPSPASVATPVNASTVQADPTAMLLLEAMVFAARADGHIDDKERSRIEQAVRHLFPGQNVDDLVKGLLGASLNPASLAARVQSAEQGEDVYRLSCLIVDIDHFMERGYLDGLAQALRIPAARKAELEREADQARRQLAELPA